MSEQCPPNLDSLFEAALKIESASERAAFLNESCGESPELRQQLEQLLASHEQVGSFMENSPIGWGATIVHTPPSQNLAASLDAGLAPSFSRDQAVVIGNAGHSVLKAIGKTIDVPRVVLREAAERGPDPIVRPNSSEMADRNTDSRYRLDGEIARGGMGAILKGHDTDLGRDLAIKVLLDQHKDRPDVVQRFIEEAQIGGQLQHPGIAPVYELGMFSDKRPFFSMKLVKGETLSALLAHRANAATERGKFIGIFEQICQTMAYAHSRGVIHRDLKPANIMVGAFGEVQVMDWGLAKVLPIGGIADEKRALDKQQNQSIVQTLRSKQGSDSPGTLGNIATFGSHTQAGSVMGTPAYMPPEQALGEVDNLDERADVFGLGAILSEILTGRPPYVADEGTQVYRLAARGRLSDCFTRLDACGADEELITLTKHCLELDPKDRPRNAGELATRVTKYLESVETRLHQAELERAAEATRVAELYRRRKLHYAIAVMLLMGLVGAGLAANHFRNLEASQRSLAASNETLAFEREQQRNAALAASEFANKQRGLAAAAALKADAERERAEQQSEIAKSERRTAEEQRDLNRRNLYIAQMQLAQQAWGQVRGTPLMASLLDNWRSADPERDLRGWEWFFLKSLEHPELLRIDLGHDNAKSCEWSPDGSMLAIVASDNSVCIVHATKGSVLHQLSSQAAPITSLSWHPDGSRLASASRDGTLCVWMVNTGTCLHMAHAGSEMIHVVRYSRDGKRIASGSDNELVLWDAEAMQKLRSLAVRCESLSWGSNDKSILCNGQKTTTLWNTTKEEAPRVLGNDDSHFSVLAASTDGTIVATANQSNILLRDVGSGRILKTLKGHGLPPYSLDFHPDGKRLVSAGEDQSLRVWDLETGETLAVLRGHTRTIASVRWSPDGHRIASNGEDIRIWHSSTRGEGTTISTANEHALVLAWSSTGEYLATAGHNGVIEIWAPAERSKVRSIHAAQNGIVTLAWHPTSPWLVSGGYDGHFRIWNTETGLLVRQFEKQEFGQASAAAWSPNGKLLATAGGPNCRAITLWNTDTWEVVRKIPDPGGYVSGVAWNRSGTRMAAVTTEGHATIWNADTFQVEFVIPRQGHTLNCLAWSSRGDRLALGGSMSDVQIWDAKTWELTTTLRGHTSIVFSLDWLPDDSRLCSASHDNTVRLWDTNHNVEVLTLRNGADQIWWAAWDPSATRLASVDYQGDLRIVDASVAIRNEGTASFVPSMERLLEKSPDNIQLLHLHWTTAVRLDKPNAEAEREKLIAACEKAIAQEDPSVQVVRTLTAALTAARQSQWTQIDPIAMTSQAGSTLTRLSDQGTILVTKISPKVDSYTIRGKCRIEQLAALRVHVLPHATLPSNGPGWGGGNFHLTEIRVSVKKPNGTVIPAKLAAAGASHYRFSAEGGEVHDGPQSVIDGGQTAGKWDIWPAIGRPNWLALGVDPPLDLGTEDELIVELDFDDEQWLNAKIGCFELQASAEPLDLSVETLCTLAASKSIQPNLSLAAAYLLSGNSEKALSVASSRTATAPDSAEAILLRAMARRELRNSPEKQVNHQALVARLQEISLQPEFRPLAFAWFTAEEKLSPFQIRSRLELSTVTRELERLGREIESEESVAKLVSRANFYSRLGRWRECADDYTRAANLTPHDRLLWGPASSARALAGDAEGYRKLCRQMLTQFRGTDQADVADFLCKSCLLMAESVPLSDLPIQVLRDGASDPRWGPFHHWFYASNALVAVRENRPEDAISWAKKATDQQGYSGALALVIQAMAEESTGRHNEAQQSLAKAESLIPVELRTLGTAGFDGPLPVAPTVIYHDWLVPEILRREVRALAARHPPK